MDNISRRTKRPDRWLGALFGIAVVVIVSALANPASAVLRVDDGSLISIWNIDEGAGNWLRDGKFGVDPTTVTDIGMSTAAGSDCFGTSVRWDAAQKAVEFYGNSNWDQVCVATNPASVADEIWQRVGSSNGLTAEVWFSPANVTDVVNIFSYGNSFIGANHSNFFIRQNGADIEFGVRNSSAPITSSPPSHPTLRAAGILQVDVPTHVVIRWQGVGAVRAWLDVTRTTSGGYSSDEPLSGTPNMTNWTTGYVYLAQQRFDGGTNFKGKVYLAAVYDRVLTDLEVGQNFSAGYLPCTDLDGDTWGDPGNSACGGGAARDCDDTQATVNPGVVGDSCAGAEQGRDNDCDGTIDDGGNGCGGSCTPTNPLGTVCDYPGAGEKDTCNDEAYSCSGLNNTVCNDTDTDLDNDSYSPCTATCTVAGGFICDCQDTGAGANTVYPGNPEICGDGKDNDCDGTVDNGSNLCGGACVLATPPCTNCTDVPAPEADTCSEDAYVCSGLNATVRSDTDNDIDNDNYSACTASCTAAQNCDCQDSGPGAFGRNPGATEICNAGTDDNCNGVADEGTNLCGGACTLAPPFADPCDDTTSPNDLDTCDDDYYTCDTINTTKCIEFDTDTDNDKYSPCNATCTIAGGDTCDCQDTGAGANTVYPGAPETCNSKDDDCDGVVDDSVATATYCKDNDGDGWGKTSSGTVVACAPPAGYDADCNDCDDTPGSGAASHPPDLASDSCVGAAQGVDNDCDGTVDDGGNACTGSCPLSPAKGTFCDFVDPADKDTCPDDTNNCTADINITACANAGTDADGDTYSACTGVGTCVPGGGAKCDCLDSGPGAAGVHDGAPETCNSVDDDCNGTIDDNPSGGTTTYYIDVDGDSHGKIGGATVDACSQPAGYAAVADDCDDGDEDKYPGNTEICDGKDNDCEGGIDEDLGTSTCGLVGSACERTVTNCVGGVPQACAPGAPGVEVCGGGDEDCDGDTDEGLGGIWYRDFDTDGFGDPNVTLNNCTKPGGYVGNASDCDDTDGGVSPGADDDCNGNTMDDCNPGTPDGWNDPEYGAGCPVAGAVPDSVCESGVKRCCQVGLPGCTINGMECKSIMAALPEQCDGLDNDCNGVIDNGCHFPLDCPVLICYANLPSCPPGCN